MVNFSGLSDSLLVQAAKLQFQKQVFQVFKLLPQRSGTLINAKRQDENFFDLL